MSITDIEQQVEKVQGEIKQLHDELNLKNQQIKDTRKMEMAFSEVYQELGNSLNKAKAAGKSTAKISKLMKKLADAFPKQAADAEAEDDWDDEN